MRFSLNFVIAAISAAGYFQVGADQTHVKRVIKEFGKRHYVTSPNAQPQINSKGQHVPSHVEHTSTYQGHTVSPSGRDAASPSEDDDTSPSDQDGPSPSGGDVNGMATAYQQVHAHCQTFTQLINNPTVDIQVAIKSFNTFEQQFSTIASRYGSQCNRCSTTNPSQWTQIVAEFASSIDVWMIIFSTRLTTFTTQCTTWSRFNQSFTTFIRLAISLQIDVKKIFLSLHLHLNLWAHFKISALGILNLSVSGHGHLGLPEIPLLAHVFGGLGGLSFPEPAKLRHMVY